ncbi:MAG: 2-amino-4-hydroxy-6-hydroxymethyldihydropteridine diphosphokinase [Piscirickettsiaceae bacterium]|nr:MAG: 2-amino-4-hydroxy-6-hydroxymethyldihydropteridine diphosphokinase [Piscirickettsiaceae bacterium]
MQACIYVGLGSNLDHPIQQVLTAIHQLKKTPNIHVDSVSNLYKTPPMGPQDQPDYINAVVKLSSSLSPHKLLSALQKIESKQNRIRNTGHWGPRTLDLDLLLYGSEIINTPELIVPHPGIALRAFVLYPLYELDNDLEIPNLAHLCDLIDQLKEPKPDIIDSEPRNE